MTFDIIYDSLDKDSMFFIQISLVNAIFFDDITNLVNIKMHPGGKCTELSEEPDQYIF